MTDAVWGLKARSAFPRLRSNSKSEGRGMKHRSSASTVGPFETFLGPVTFLGLVRSCTRVSGGFRFRSSGKTARLVHGGGSLSVELGAMLELLKQLRVFAHLAACSECVGPQRLGLQSVLGRHPRLPPLRQWSRGNGSARLLLLRAGSRVLESHRGVDGSNQP